ncbi:putative disease resistance RPP13-like protein 1 [Platanthera guangdongensis]|uniref:Disease resistance RPP13-like protein 1 n=1 Tax=Platanthera guangdongensis TaxID=2320717 RepID=A0ABR2M7T4_9ASPA
MQSIRLTNNTEILAEVVATSLLKFVSDQLPSKALSEFALLTDADKELRKPERTLSTIQDVLEDVESQQVKDKDLRNWLRKLKDLAYDADDVLGDFQVRERHCEEETCSFINESDVYGRKDDKEKIVNLLLEPFTHGPEIIGVVSIVCLGRFGMTTLAQLVYNDEWVHDRFENQMLVSVFDGFEIRRLIRLIIESVTRSGFCLMFTSPRYNTRLDPETQICVDIEKAHSTRTSIG